MATTRHAHTVWEGNLLKGQGTVTFDSSDVPDQAVIVQRGALSATYACGDRCSKLGGDAAGDMPAK